MVHQQFDKRVVTYVDSRSKGHKKTSLLGNWRQQLNCMRSTRRRTNNTKKGSVAAMLHVPYM